MHVTSAPFKCVSNGQGERAVPTLKKWNKEKITGRSMETKLSSRFLFQNGNAPHSTTEVPPASGMFINRELHTPRSQVHHNLKSTHQRGTAGNAQ